MFSFKHEVVTKAWQAEIRRREAEDRRYEREAKRRYRELEQRIKQRAKLSLQEQARLEVAAFENELELLLSVHREQSLPMEWPKFAAALPPHPPFRKKQHEFVASLRMAATSDELTTAIAKDEEEFLKACDLYETERSEWQQMQQLALKVLAGEVAAYSEAIKTFSSLGEISQLGSAVHLTARSSKLVECLLTVNGSQIIPSEVKSLTAAGKLSVKAMPKGRFHEVYQDYVCACVLRLAREVLALLPVDQVLVTASVPQPNAQTGKVAEVPVVSAVMSREAIAQLDFEHLDPSDSMRNFTYRGEVAVSRKSGEFIAIAPIQAADLMPNEAKRLCLGDLLAEVRQRRQEIGGQLRAIDGNRASA